MTTGAPQVAVTREVQFSSICRTCLGSEDTFNLFQTKYEEIGLYEIINSYMAIQVQENDRLPQNICEACICSMVNMFVFIKQCESSDASLHAFLNNSRKSKMRQKPLILAKSSTQRVIKDEHIPSREKVVRQVLLVAPISNLGKTPLEHDVMKSSYDSDPLADVKHPTNLIQSSEHVNCIEEKVKELTAKSQSTLINLLEQHLLLAPVSVEGRLRDDDVIIISDDSNPLTDVQHTVNGIQSSGDVNCIEVEVTAGSESTVIKPVEQHSLFASVCTEGKPPDDDVVIISEDSDPLRGIQHTEMGLQNKEDIVNCIESDIEVLSTKSQSTLIKSVEQYSLFSPVSIKDKHLETNVIPDISNPFANIIQRSEDRDLTDELQSTYKGDAFDSTGTWQLHKKLNHSRPSNSKSSAPLSLHNSDVSILEYLLKCNKNSKNAKNKAVNLRGIPLNDLQQENIGITTELHAKEQNDTVSINLTPIAEKEALTKKIRCVSCNFTCDSFCTLKLHWRMNHLQNNKRTIKSGAMRCRTCEKSFTSRKRYFKHMEMHKKQLKRCNEILLERNLDKNFAFDYTNLRGYLLKLKTCHINIYPCTHCDKFFVKHLQFKEHQKSIKLLAKVLNNPSLLLNEKTNSELCLEGQENERTANMVENENSHTNKEITQENDFLNCLKRLKESNQFPLTLYWCRTCIQFFDYREQYLLHKKQIKHFRPLKHPCPICNKLFRRRSSLTNHMRSHTKEKPYVCDVCGAEFGFRVSFNRHMMLHTGEKPYVCEICGKGFIQLVTLQQHQTSHTGECPYLCSYCGIQCKQYSTYANHLKKYHTVAALDTISQKAFMARKRLKTHTNPRKEKTLVCQYCGKFFISAAALHCHVRIHTGDRPYKCAICNATHAQKAGLNNHMRCHTGEKPYQCKICLRTFRQISHRAYHMVSVHTKQKLFKCLYCEKCFALKGNLTSHTRIHTGETPFACNVCGKRFYHSNNMKKHRRTHEKVNAKTEGVT